VLRSFLRYISNQEDILLLKVVVLQIQTLPVYICLRWAVPVIKKEMKGIKRMFGRKKKNNPTPSTVEDTQFQSEPLPKPKKPSTHPSVDPVDSSRSIDNTNGKTETKTTAEKIFTVKSPAIQTSKEVKQEILNPPPGDNKNTSSSKLNLEKEKNPSSLAATKPTTTTTKDDTTDTRNTKTPAKDDMKNGGRSPVDKKVDEVVVPRSGTEDRHATISKAYDSIPLLEQTKLPRGGISIETAAIGRVQVRLIVCFVCLYRTMYIISYTYMNKSGNCVCV
jgi:hypothetical protein